MRLSIATHIFLKTLLILAGFGLPSGTLLCQENTQILCSDGVDNDGDGLVDCEDGDCLSLCTESLLGECVTIDFESILGETPTNQTLVENQYLGQGVRFRLDNGESPVLVDYGGTNDGFNGVGADMPDPAYEEQLGAFFITDDGQSGGADAFTIILEFQLPVNSVSGDILDIDYSETFEARAYDQDGNLISSVLITTNSFQTGNGIPTPWQIIEEDACIWEIQLEGQSNSTTSFGYGLDNFEFCYGELENLCQCLSDDTESLWLESICFGCTDPLACNYNPDSLNDNDSCIYPDGCTDSEACNYDENAQCDDGSCLYGDGCTDPAACNYDPEAECDSGMCTYPDGCTDSEACNFSFLAECDDGSCVYPDGCTDSIACNYNPAAECDDGSCDYSCLGCTDPVACNFEPEVTVDDNSCTYPGCTDATACNYDYTAGCDDGSCILPDGCNTPSACNYNPLATCDDGSCDFISCADCAGVPFGLSVIDTCGVCILPDDELFNYSCVGSLYIPNSFTPNNDGLNDVFITESARVLRRFEIWIYNRWGQLVFHSTDPTEAWNGNHADGEYYVPNGLYTYMVKYAFGPNDALRKTGSISIVR